MKLKFKYLTEDEQWDICDSVEGMCSRCPIGKKVRYCNKEFTSKEDLEKEIDL